MRVAAIYDIHGNLPALEAVLAEIHEIGVDQIVVGGDVVPGPMPCETVARLRQLPATTQFIPGNGENDVLAALDGREISRVPEQFHETLRWTGEALSPKDADVLASWPDVLRLDIPEVGPVLFCHATPRSDAEIFTRLTPQDRLLPIFEDVDAAVVVCGHTHMQFDRRIGNVRVVNAGSVGMPFGEPGADWLLLGPTVELRHTTYDLAAAAELILDSDYPPAQDFAERSILRPPTEAEMLDLFERAAV